MIFFFLGNHFLKVILLKFYYVNWKKVVPGSIVYEEIEFAYQIFMDMPAAEIR